MTPILTIPTGRGVTRSVAPFATTGGGAYAFGSSTSFVGDPGGGGGGGVIPSEDYGGYKTFQDVVREVQDRARRDSEREAEQRRIPQRAAKAIRKVVRTSLPSLAGLDEIAQLERLRALLRAQNIAYMAAYDAFLASEMSRFAEEEAVFVLLTLSAAVQ